MMRIIELSQRATNSDETVDEVHSELSRENEVIRGLANQSLKQFNRVSNAEVLKRVFGGPTQTLTKEFGPGQAGI